MKQQMHRMACKSIFCTWIISSVLLTFSSCNKRSNYHEIRIAALSTPHAEMLEVIQPDLKKEGISLKIIRVDDYMIPNRLLVENQVDANFFQHEPFLREQSKAMGWELEVLTRVHLAPLGIYSQQISSLHTIPPRATIAISSDPSNQSRALCLLQAAHILNLAQKQEQELYSKEDIIGNPCCAVIRTVDAALLPRVLSDVTLAVIPANFACQIGLLPKDALMQEQPNLLYANVIAVRRGDHRSEWERLCFWIHSEKMKEHMTASYENSFTILS